ncbi:MAG: SpoIIE family protein phosphatase [Deltaproteobacteria bacterium]|nr:SpoIIE family protein phosphatase [Deltaproteobacteria bacterium]
MTVARPRHFRFAQCGRPRPGPRRPEDWYDDRVLVDADAGLACLADAQGPSYGGYHAPVGLDEALRLFHERSSAPGGTLDDGFDAAGEFLFSCHDMWTRLSRRAPGLDGLHRAGIEVARTRLHREVATFVHFTTSLTAVHLTGHGLEVRQVGGSRAYLVRDRSPELLLPDHMLDTIAPHLDPDGVHRTVSTRLLGFEERVTVDRRLVAVTAGDVVALCSDGVWRAESEMNEILPRAAENLDSAARELASLAPKTHDHATAVVLLLTAEPER